MGVGISGTSPWWCCRYPRFKITEPGIPWEQWKADMTDMFQQKLVSTPAQVQALSMLLQEACRPRLPFLPVQSATACHLVAGVCFTCSTYIALWRAACGLHSGWTMPSACLLLQGTFSAIWAEAGALFAQVVWKDYSPSHFSGGTGTFNGIDESLKEVPSRVKCEPASVGEFWWAYPSAHLGGSGTAMCCPHVALQPGARCAVCLHACTPCMLQPCPHVPCSWSLCSCSIRASVSAGLTFAELMPIRCFWREYFCMPPSTHPLPMQVPGLDQQLPGHVRGALQQDSCAAHL